MGAGPRDRDTVDRARPRAVPPGEESYLLRRLWLTPEEEKGYYYGFSNEGLWPLCHLAHARPIFRREDWEHYQNVNRRFADAVCAEVDSDDPIVLVQDYHFALAPALIRERLPRATIIMFWHIPWPELGASSGSARGATRCSRGCSARAFLGFHTQSHCNNFIDSADRFLEARIDRERNAVVRGGREPASSGRTRSRWNGRRVGSRRRRRVGECRASVIRELQPRVRTP